MLNKGRLFFVRISLLVVESGLYMLLIPSSDFGHILQIWRGLCQSFDFINHSNVGFGLNLKISQYLLISWLYV